MKKAILHILQISLSLHLPYLYYYFLWENLIMELYENGGDFVLEVNLFLFIHAIVIIAIVEILFYLLDFLKRPNQNYLLIE
jgi:hypothetical protein